jgi:hypothetical protein
MEVSVDNRTVKTRLSYQQLVVLGPDEPAPQPRAAEANAKVDGADAGPPDQVSSLFE